MEEVTLLKGKCYSFQLSSRTFSRILNVQRLGAALQLQGEIVV